MFKVCIALFLVACMQEGFSDNQTPDISSIESPKSLPFELSVERADFSLPEGLQSFVFGVHKDKWLLLSGNNHGLHYFSEGIGENTTAFVVDLKTKQIYQRSLYDEASLLNQREIAALSLVGSSFTQTGNNLYVVGGYTLDSSTGQFITMPTLTAIDVPGLIDWVINPGQKKIASQYVRQIVDPIFQVAGGSLFQENAHTPFLLMFGQNFSGVITQSSNGVYTQQVRTFKLLDDGVNLTVFAKEYKPQNSSYRRANLNVSPCVQLDGKLYKDYYMALSGVFTTSRGIWTVPISVSLYGDTFMPNPSSADTFKQGMNNYTCPYLGLFSKKSGQMNVLLFGGLSYETYTDGTFSLDSQFPFTNNITDISIDKNGQMSQHLMATEYPVVLSTFTDPPSPVFLGTKAEFIQRPNLPIFQNGVISLDDLKGPTLVGYIVGGVQSTVPNTNSTTDTTLTAASPYIFKVIIRPKK